VRHGDLRHEAAAVLLGHLPVQGEAEAGEESEREERSMWSLGVTGGVTGVTGSLGTAAQGRSLPLMVLPAKVGRQRQVWQAGSFSVDFAPG
jgi:hypothetical protein